MTQTNIFKKLGLPENPIILAPLAGVSDHPFRLACTQQGADLTYVEMISATALTYHSPRTLNMLYRHKDEQILGVQVTSRTAPEMGEAVKILADKNFDTIDINMGCPVKKVVRSGCGSGILKDPRRVYETTAAAVAASPVPVSVKIRMGWDHTSINYQEVGKAAEDAGASWLTIHGRTRNDDYGKPVNLEAIGKLKEHLSIPVIGNGNIFSYSDMEQMLHGTSADGLMVSRGSLGNPFIFKEWKTKGSYHPSLEEWRDLILSHLQYQLEHYGEQGAGAVCMRKHLIWYSKGWPGSKKLREQFSFLSDLTLAPKLIEEFYNHCKDLGVTHRQPLTVDANNRFLWDPKFDMDRKLDRGIGHERLEDPVAP